MTTTSVRGRIPAGVPTGGQFASMARTEPGLTLLDSGGDADQAMDALTSLSARGVSIRDASAEEIDALSFHINDSVRETAAKHTRDPFVLDRLARDETAWVRRAVVENEHTPETLVEDLTNDPADGVRTAARSELRRRRTTPTPPSGGPVHGPGRGRAAARALAELAAARTARENDPWSTDTHRRLTEAQRVRDFYPEYDDYRDR